MKVRVACFIVTRVKRLSVSLSILAQDRQVNAWFLVWEFLRWCWAFKTCLYSEQSGLRWTCVGAFGGHCNIAAQPFWYVRLLRSQPSL